MRERESEDEGNWGVKGIGIGEKRNQKQREGEDREMAVGISTVHSVGSWRDDRLYAPHTTAF